MTCIDNMICYDNILYICAIKHTPYFNTICYTMILYVTHYIIYYKLLFYTTNILLSTILYTNLLLSLSLSLYIYLHYKLMILYITNFYKLHYIQ